MKLIQLIVLVAALLVLTPVAWPQGSQKESEGRYALLATTRTSTMQKELDEAAAQGYRILVGSPTAGSEMALFMERIAEPPNTYTYKLLATTRTGTMERELNESAEAGFRLLPSTMIAKKQIMGGVEIVLIMERVPKPEKAFQYKLLATQRTSTLQKEVLEAKAAGFVLVGMVSRGEHMVIMEKEIDIKQ